MSNFILSSIPFDDENIVDREPEVGDGRHHFGFLRLYTLQVTKVFKAGNHVTIPGVTGGDFNDKDESGLMMFKGWKPGGNQFLFVMVGTKQNKEEEDYQVVKQYPNKVKKEDPHLWGDIVLPSIMELPVAERDKLGSEGAWCEWDEITSGHTFEADDGNEREIKAWGNFTLHANETSLKEANDDFFAQFDSTADDTQVDTKPFATLTTRQAIDKIPVDSPYPAAWFFDGEDDGGANLKWAQEQALEHGWNPAKVIEKLELKEALTTSGKPVDVNWLVSVVLTPPITKDEIPF